MSEIKEYLNETGHHVETPQLDPEVTKSGVEHIDDEKKLEEVNQILKEHHPEHYIGDRANLPIEDPSVQSEMQVNGETIPMAPETTATVSHKQGIISMIGTGMKSAWDSIIHPDAFKEGLQKGVGHSTVRELELPIPFPTKQESGKIIPISQHKNYVDHNTEEEVAHAG